MATLKELSKKSWEGGGTLDSINSGSLQRIADACELMAKRYADLIDERDRYKRIVQQRDSEIARLNNEARTLRGVITRHRNERDRLKEELQSLQIEIK